jgi:sugar/nucleoside kinase (ribokinase family)
VTDEMTERRGILAGGNWIVDRLKFIDTYPREDALANIISESVGNGGSPFNILIDLAKLAVDLPLYGVGLIGADAEGDWIKRQCTTHGIDITQLRMQSAAHTSYTDVMTVRGTGRRTFFHQRGANALLGDEHFDFSSNRAKHFHLGYLLLLDRLDQPDPEFGTVAARTLHRASEAGFTTSIDVVSEDSERFAQVVLPALPHVDYCLLNEFELERTTGTSIRLETGIDPKALQCAAGALLGHGVRRIIVVHFPEGACALGHDGRLHLKPALRVPQPQIASAVGAGDAFAAGVLYALHENQSVDAALQCGVCVAAACLQGVGASEGICSLSESLRLEERFGVRSLS